MKVRVLVLPKNEVLDSQGRTLGDFLSNKGYANSNCKLGKVIELEVPDQTNLKEFFSDEVCSLLYNPLIEQMTYSQVDA